MDRATPKLAALFQPVTFELSVADLRQLPVDDGLEAAFAGRSNAGKSSAINAICGRHRLAFVSRTPGRTQVINFYRLAQERHLVDLPGYGYAQVPAALRGAWEQLLEGYLRRRQALAGLIVVMDIRHPLTPLDRQMLDWMKPTGRPVHILLTKADKLTRQAARRQLTDTLQALPAIYPLVSAQLFSSTEHTGVDEARDQLINWLAMRDDIA